MRIRATVAAVSGALALSAIVAPAAQAAPSGDRTPAPLSGPWASGSAGTFGAAAKAKAPAEAPVIKKVVVNGGKPIVAGISAKKKVTIAITASQSSGIADAATILWIGSDLDDENADDVYWFEQNEEKASCKAANATTSTCTLTVTVDPKQLINTDATFWKVGAYALGKDEASIRKDDAAKIRMQRASQLTVAATPKPVKKGKTLTVTGKLSRANWETEKYAGYAGQPVKLQFRKKNSKTYTTIKTVKGSSTGTLKTTTKKTTAEGYWRWSFAGTASTPAVNAPGTLVKIKK
ncbi:DUF5707 domain-containing protein [Streptomyces paludis]|uniref:Calcium-binding protein n=1 Tax=Streptomyces paludis TaxID=2282738 RepID=A0A345HS00_9ACTN|nr:DUF5707 domain-containing protein [Streptomyces paludis]AXG79474.1 calcium-binding protein [Streptomyces paludis]